MKKYARIHEGAVVELLETDGDITQMFHPDLIWVEITNLDPQPQAGWAYDGGEFSEPTVAVPEPQGPIVPHEVEGWQAEVAMRITKIDTDDEESQTVWDRVQDLIAAMPDGIEKITVQTALARGKIRRDSPTLAQLAPLVPLSEARVDDLLILADAVDV